MLLVHHLLQLQIPLFMAFVEIILHLTLMVVLVALLLPQLITMLLHLVLLLILPELIAHIQYQVSLLPLLAQTLPFRLRRIKPVLKLILSMAGTKNLVPLTRSQVMPPLQLFKLALPIPTAANNGLILRLAQSHFMLVGLPAVTLPSHCLPSPELALPVAGLQAILPPLGATTLGRPSPQQGT